MRAPCKLIPLGKLKRLLFITLLLFGTLSVAVTSGEVSFPSLAEEEEFSDRKVGPLSRQWKLGNLDGGNSFVFGVYRSYHTMYVDLDPTPEINLWDENEFRLYRQLMIRSLKPGFITFEMTGYPLASLSAWMEEEQGEFFSSLTFGEDFNILRSLGAGVQEPWSMSLFIGQLADFLEVTEKEEVVRAASGASGLVITGGLYQLFDNCFVPSNWFRLEWKLKGGGERGSKKQEWDIKAGYRNYGLPDISNAISFVFSRLRADRSDTNWGLTKNSLLMVDLQVPVSEFDSGFSRILVSYGKIIPFKGKFVGLKIGFGYENRRKYDGETKEFRSEKEELREIFFHPVVMF